MVNFRRDLKRGQKYEHEALKLFKYSKYKMSVGKFKEYDFILDDKIKVEVKADFIAYRTNNIVIEYEHNGKDSGINTTTADFWVYYIVKCGGADVYKVPTNDLKNICLNHSKIIKGGDYKNTYMYLFNKSKLEKYKININCNNRIKNV